MSVAFEDWIARQYAYSAKAMLMSVSPIAIVQARPGFGQTVRPVRGSIVASPIPAAWDPEPDYFFHWYRDSAVVIDAIRILHEDGTLGAEAPAHVADFIRFSLGLRNLDGRRLVEARGWRRAVAPDFEKFVRTDEDLAAVHGDAVFADTRVNPNGTLDISRWSRPQHDGPPARALALLRWIGSDRTLAPAEGDRLTELLRGDLDFTLRRWKEPCFDIWEEEEGRHYYTLSLSAAALAAGADWLESEGDDDTAAACRGHRTAILRELDAYWDAGRGFYRSRILADGRRSAKELDISVVFAAIHAGLAKGAHSPSDPRILATLDRLDALFAAAYPINHDRAAGHGAAMGRYEGDTYFSGGAYYFSTLAAAELLYRAAAAGAGAPAALLERGDGYLRTVQAFTPASGEMSEQFDQKTGAQTSARHLAWSYAAFVSCVSARRAALSSRR